MSNGTAGIGTILAVDDEPDILIALEDLFEDSYRVLTTSNPNEALEILHAEPDIAVVLSDQRMPGLTGDALLAEARAFHDAQAILLTGYADITAVIAALNRGGKDFPDLTPDGRVGPRTLGALDAFLQARGQQGGETVLMRALEALQGERYLRLAERRPANEAFLYGWLANRIG